MPLFFILYPAFILFFILYAAFIADRFGLNLNDELRNNIVKNKFHKHLPYELKISKIMLIFSSAFSLGIFIFSSNFIPLIIVAMHILHFAYSYSKSPFRSIISGNQYDSLDKTLEQMNIHYKFTALMFAIDNKHYELAQYIAQRIENKRTSFYFYHTYSGLSFKLLKEAFRINFKIDLLTRLVDKALDDDNYDLAIIQNAIDLGFEANVYLVKSVLKSKASRKQEILDMLNISHIKDEVYSVDGEEVPDFLKQKVS